MCECGNCTTTAEIIPVHKVLDKTSNIISALFAFLVGVTILAYVPRFGFISQGDREKQEHRSSDPLFLSHSSYKCFCPLEQLIQS